MLRSEMKALAKERMKGQWGNAILIMVLSGLITGVAGLLGTLLGPLSFVVTLAVGGPIVLGTVHFYMKVGNGEKAEIGDWFWGFRNFTGAFVLFFLQRLFIALWSLLFLIPGIIKSYSYSMAFYIMEKEPEISSKDALEKSKEIMNGHRMELFVLQLSFFGWVLLAVVTLGIANFYVLPYMNETMALFYKNLLDGSIQTDNCIKEENRYINAAVANAESNIHKFSISDQNTCGDTEILRSNPSNDTIVLNQSNGKGTFTGLKGGLSGLCYMLEDGVEYSIGRDKTSCGIVIDNGNSSISRLHCTVQYTATRNGYYVIDQSSNGTFADGVRLPKGQLQFVQRGAVITLGNQEEGFRLE